MNSRAATEDQPAVPARFTDRERPGAIPLWGRERISWYDLLAFAAPLFRFVRFPFVGYFLNPYGYSLTEPCKFGVGHAISGLIVLLATCCYARRFVCAGLLLFAGLLNVFMVSRAAGLVCALATSFVGSQALLSQGTKRSAAHTLMLPAAILLATFAIARTYAFAANHGLLGAKPRLAYQSQSSGSFGVLVVGLRDSLASIRAIMDSPIIGHGSWPTGSTYTLYLAHLMASLGYRNSPAGAAIKR